MKKLFQVGNILFFIGMVVVNILANTIPINNQTTGEISDKYPNLFVPAGLTFLIWAVLYSFLFLFSVYQAKDLFKKNPDSSNFVMKINFLFILSSIANIAWIFLWHYNFVFLSLIAIIILFGSLLTIYLKLNIGKNKCSALEKMFVHIPFSSYLGWMTVATIASFTAFLVSINWNGFGIDGVVWTIIIISVVFVITSLMIITRGDIFYSLVILWALFGIILKRLSDATPIMSIIITCIVAMSIIFVEMVISLIIRKRV